MVRNGWLGIETSRWGWKYVAGGSRTVVGVKIGVFKGRDTWMVETGVVEGRDAWLVETGVFEGRDAWLGSK